MASKKNRNTKPKCLNYFRCDGAKRSLEHRIYLGGQISTAVVTSGTFMPWFLFVEDEDN